MKKANKKAVVLFDAGEIEFSVKSSILKNTLPAVRDNWKKWLDSYNAADLETDEDFKQAAEFVSSCKETEDKLEELEETALRGDASKVIEEIRSMREATRAKRLEFSRAVDNKKDKVKGDAIAAAVLKVRTELAKVKYKPEDLDIEGDLRAAIKGKSAILKMNEALEADCARILAAASEYSTRFEALRADVAAVYKEANEPATESEIDMLVKTYADGAPERARFILDQKRVKREQDELDRKKRESEAAAAQTAPEAAQKAPEAPAAAPSALSAAAIPGKPLKVLRFGATFETADPEYTISQINSIGGRDVKFQEFPKK